jgi:hypothetical protein
MVRDRLVSIIENLAPTPFAWMAIVVGVFVHLAAFFLFKVEVPGLRPTEDKPAYVTFVTLSGDSADQNLRERALLADSVPLFLPSEVDYAWISMQPSFYDDDREANLLDPFSMDVGVSGSELLRSPSFYANLAPEDLLSSEMVPVLKTLGEAEFPELNMEERFGVFQFKLEASHNVVAEFPIPTVPSGLQLFDFFWRPCSILVVVSETGSMGKPIVRESSGLVDLDRYAVDWVERAANQKLIEPGYYRVTFGP